MARMKLEDALARPSTVDRARLDATTEDDIRRHMIEDGQDPDEEMDPEFFIEVFPPQEVRRRLGLSQDAFAAALRIPAATLRNWEQGRTRLDPAVQALFRILGREPAAAMRALGVTMPGPRARGGRLGGRRPSEPGSTG